MRAKNNFFETQSWEEVVNSFLCFYAGRHKRRNLMCSINFALLTFMAEALWVHLPGSCSIL